MSLLYQRARNSGSCPPSILLEECSAFDNVDGFEVAMNKVIDDTGAYPLVRRPCIAATSADFCNMNFAVFLTVNCHAVCFHILVRRFPLKTWTRYIEEFEGGY